MITTKRSGFLFSCDFCSTEITIKADEMPDAMTIAHNKGWRVARHPATGKPLDKCPCCVENAATVVTGPLRFPG